MSPIASQPDGQHEWLHVRGCLQKRAFPTKRDAKREIKRRAWNDVEPYGCQFCGCWHLGHPNPRYVQKVTP